jgi:hypothetical protein
MAQDGFVAGGAEVGQALRDAAAAIGQGETVVKEVEGGFEAPNAVIDYYAKLTVSPKEGEQPTEPGEPNPPTEENPPYPDNTLPGPGSAGGEHPDNTLPEPEQPTEPTNPDDLPHPDNTLPGPGSAGGEHPDNTLPGEQPYPDNSLPGEQPYPDNSLPGEQPYPDNSLPGEQPYPDNSLPGEQPEIDNSLPGPGSAGGEHPDNTLPTPEPQPEQPEVEEPDNPLQPGGEIPDESWTVQEIKDWAKDNDIELSTGMRKDDILVVIRNETGQQ